MNYYNKRSVIVLFLILVILFFIGLNNFLLFHTMVEIFTILVASMICVLGITTHKYSGKICLLYFSYSYIFIALLDFLHCITYKGMNIINGCTFDTATQFWIVGRALEAIMFLLVPLSIKRKPPNPIVLLSYILITTFSIVSIIFTDLFPHCLIEETGLTNFKIISEYIICLIILLATVHTFFKKNKLDPTLYKILLGAMMSFILSELSFTLYHDPYGLMNIIGHIFRTITYLLIFQGVVLRYLSVPYHELRLAYDETLISWARILELRDHETEGHSARVTELTACLARQLKISEKEIGHMARGALLHDIGKVAIPDYILFKPGPLTNEEKQIMQKHPEYAYELIKSINYLLPALDIPLYHHEKWDGTGYPAGLKEKEIPLAARIFAFADVWDALRSNRPYRCSWSEEQCCKYILDQSGKHFDPSLVETFLSMAGCSKK